MNTVSSFQRLLQFITPVKMSNIFLMRFSSLAPQRPVTKATDIELGENRKQNRRLDAEVIKEEGG